jgi:hypothetical protein
MNVAFSTCGVKHSLRLIEGRLPSGNNPICRGDLCAPAALDSSRAPDDAHRGIVACEIGTEHTPEP